MTDKTILLNFISGFGRIIFKIAFFTIAVLILDLIGLGFFGLLTSEDMLSRLWIVLVTEGFIMMMLGLLGTTTLPQMRTIGVPWSQSVRTVNREIRKDRKRQVKFWISVAVTGFVLFILGLLLNSFLIF